MTDFIVLIPLIIFFVGIGFVVFTIRKSSNSFKKLISDIGGTVNGRGEGVVSLQGKEVFVKYTPGSKNRSPEFQIYTPGLFGAPLVIRPETARDRFFKRIGLNRELEVPDFETNERLYFECDDQQFLQQLFLNANVKQELFEVLKNYSSVEISPKRCLFKKYPSFELSLITPQWVKESIERLVKFASIVPPASGNHFELTAFKLKSALLYSVGMVAFGAGIVAFFGASIAYPVVEGMQLWGASANHVVPIVLTGAAVGFYLIKGFSKSATVFLYFVIPFCIGVVLCGRYGTAVYNGYYDTAEPTVFETVIFDKYTTTHKGSTTYHVVAQAWRSNLPNWEFTEDSNTYARIKPGETRCRITTKPGRLDFEWILDEELVFDAESSTVSWPGRNYQNWYPLPQTVADIDPEEMAYWQSWTAIMEEGITNRMNVHDTLGKPHRAEFYTVLKNEYLRRQDAMLRRLSQLAAPARLESFHDQVLQAGRDQMEFYKTYIQNKLQNPAITFNDLRADEHLKVSDQTLWAAYYNFQALYPARPPNFNDAIEKRLAWFDII